MDILIIGGDAAGMSAASQIRRRQPDWKVRVLERGNFTSYASCGIPYYLAGDVKSFDDLVVVTPEEFREKRGIDVRIGWQADAIDTTAKAVATSTGEGALQTLFYDRLLIATGASPIVPAWEGVDLLGVMPIRNLAHAQALDRLLESGPRRCVIIGAGYVGLEMAEALRRRGLDVTILEKLPGVMGGVSPQVTDRVRSELEHRGVALRLEVTVEGFSGSDGRLETVETSEGAFPADLAIISLGVRPNVELARDAGIALGSSGAVKVDVRQRTDAPDVFAAGDCAEAHHLVLGRPAWIPLALTANRQGRVAGANMAGTADVFPGVVGSAVTKVFDLAIARTGIDEAVARSEGIPFKVVEVSAPSKAHYYPGHDPVWIQLIYRADNHKILGGWLVGHDPSVGKRADVLATAITAGMSVEQVADLDLTYAPPFSPVWDPVLQAANRARFQIAREAKSGKR